MNKELNPNRELKKDEVLLTMPNEGCCSPEFTEGCIIREENE